MVSQLSEETDGGSVMGRLLVFVTFSRETGATGEISQWKLHAVIALVMKTKQNGNIFTDTLCKNTSTD